MIPVSITITVVNFLHHMKHLFLFFPQIDHQHKRKQFNRSLHTCVPIPTPTTCYIIYTLSLGYTHPTLIALTYTTYTTCNISMIVCPLLCLISHDHHRSTPLTRFIIYISSCTHSGVYCSPPEMHEVSTIGWSFV